MSNKEKQENNYYKACETFSAINDGTLIDGVYHINLKRSHTTEAIEKAEKRSFITHYTNIDSVLKILKSKSIKFNRIDNVNDIEESNFVNNENLVDRIFVSCFYHGNDESIPLWHMYTKRGVGVSITFYMKQGIGIKNIFDQSQMIMTDLSGSGISWDADNKNVSIGNVSGFKCQDVIYSIGEKEKNTTVISEAEESIDYDLGAFAAFKDSGWSYEEETRFTIFLRYDKNAKPVKCVFVPLTFEHVDKIIITFNPWIEPELRDCIKHEIESYLLNVDIEFKDSRFKGKIYRK